MVIVIKKIVSEHIKWDKGIIITQQLVTQELILISIVKNCLLYKQHPRHCSIAD